jgi:ubiquinone biosynthesis protein UbiJ
VIAFLRQRYPSKTPDHVAADTGVPAGTVQKWLDRGSAPSVAHYTRLWLAYGPEFLAATIERAPAWLDAAHRAEEAARLKAEIAAREARLAKLEEGA